MSGRQQSSYNRPTANFLLSVPTKTLLNIGGYMMRLLQELNGHGLFLDHSVFYTARFKRINLVTSGGRSYVGIFTLAVIAPLDLANTIRRYTTLLMRLNVHATLSDPTKSGFDCLDFRRLVFDHPAESQYPCIPPTAHFSRVLLG